MCFCTQNVNWILADAGWSHSFFFLRCSHRAIIVETNSGPCVCISGCAGERGGPMFTKQLQKSRLSTVCCSADRRPRGQKIKFKTRIAHATLLWCVRVWPWYLPVPLALDRIFGKLIIVSAKRRWWHQRMASTHTKAEPLNGQHKQRRAHNRQWTTWDRLSSWADACVCVCACLTQCYDESISVLHQNQLK